MKMTLFADASFCAKTGAVGWGSWAIRDEWDRGRFRGGPLTPTRPVHNSNAAEVAGIGMSLWQHSQLGDLQGLTSILIQCDNVAALGYIYTAAPRAIRSGKLPISKANWRTDAFVGDVVKTIVDLLAGVPQINLRHVKGHTKNDDGRSWVNRRCDAEAKKFMLLQRKRLNELQSV